MKAPTIWLKYELSKGEQRERWELALEESFCRPYLQLGVLLLLFPDDDSVILGGILGLQGQGIHVIFTGHIPVRSYESVKITSTPRQINHFYLKFCDWRLTACLSGYEGCASIFVRPLPLSQNFLFYVKTLNQTKNKEKSPARAGEDIKANFKPRHLKCITWWN